MAITLTTILLGTMSIEKKQRQSDYANGVEICFRMSRNCGHDSTRLVSGRLLVQACVDILLVSFLLWSIVFCVMFLFFSSSFSRVMEPLAQIWRYAEGACVLRTTLQY
jgi:hypothetical protein